MPLGIDPNYLFLGGAVGSSIVAGFTALGAISNRGRMAAANVDATARRNAANTIAQAIMAEHGNLFTPRTEFESACTTSSEHIARMGAAIAALQQEFGKFGRKLNDLEKQVLSGQVHGQDTWVNRGLVGRDVAAAAAERHTPHGGTPVQPAPVRSALALPASSPNNGAAITHVLPQLGPDGLPAASGGAGLFTVDPGTAARQRVTMVVATPEMRELADRFQQARKDMGDALPLDLLWNYMHNLLPDADVFLWSHCSRHGETVGTWYDTLRPTVEQALKVRLEATYEQQFPAYQTTNEYERWTTLTDRTEKMAS